jgi:hypothetical protein
MDIEQFNEFVLVPALTVIGLNSESANVLMLGTALIESGLVFLEQLGPGRGLGIYQMEQPTHLDMQRYLNQHHNSRLKERCLAACFYQAFPSEDALIHNLRYATVMARIKYWMRSDPLPAFNDAEGMATYHKRFYNSHLGKTNPSKSVRIFESVIEGLNFSEDSPTPA